MAGGDGSTVPAGGDSERHDLVPAYQPFRAGEVTDRYEVDSTGRFLGSVHLPSRFTVHEFGNEDVLGVWIDEYDVQHVRRYAIQR